MEKNREVLVTGDYSTSGSFNRKKENSFSPITIKLHEKGRVGQKPRVKLNESPPLCEIIIVIPHTDYGGSLPLIIRISEHPSSRHHPP